MDRVQRFRLRFRKTGTLRYIGHIDLMRAMERLFRRASIKMAMSQGFHPKPRVSFPSALGLGYDGDDEVCELELLDEGEVATGDLLARLNAVTLEGLDFLLAERLTAGMPKARLAASVYEVAVPREAQDKLAAKIADFLGTKAYCVIKTSGKELDIRDSIEAMEWDAATERLSVTLRAHKEARSGPEANLRDALVPLGLEPLLFRSLHPRRTEVRLC